MWRGLTNTHVRDFLTGLRNIYKKLGRSGRVKHNIAQDRGGLLAAHLSFDLALFVLMLWLWVLSGWPRPCRLQMPLRRALQLQEAEAAHKIWMQGDICVSFESIAIRRTRN